MKRLGILLVGLLIIGAALGFGAWQTGRWSPFGTSGVAGADKGGKQASAKDGKKDGKGSRPAIVVRTARVEITPMPVVIDVVGTIESEHVVAVRPQVSGLLTQVMVKEGDRVRAGQTMFRIDSRQIDASINQAKAAVARDQANLELARANEKRLRPLLERDFITRAEYETTAANVAALQAQVEANRAQLEQVQVQLDFTYIRATIDGRLGALSVRAGNLVSASTSSTSVPLVTINRTNPVLVSFNVPQEVLSTVRKFQTSGELNVQVLREQGAEVLGEGKLVFIDNNVNAQTGTIIMKARLTNDKETLWPGQFVAVRMVLTTEPEAIVVPEAAVQPGQQGSFVYVFQPGEGDAAGRARIQTVRIDRQLGDRVVIASGLNGGELVITEVPPGLAPGAPVRLPAKGEGKGAGKKGAGAADGKGGGAKGDAISGDVKPPDAASEPRKTEQAK
ncbi:MAG: efflux RND transporter periplasmic adaptor subunit [Proteobacteria bacterium]|nr:efflux RND transporter periplasmic adaptor subunit [Burkholderiales bacterium]